MANTIEIVIRATDDASKVIAKMQGEITASTGLMIKKIDESGKSIQTIDKKLQDFGKGMSKLGDKMSLFVTAPIVAAGTAAIKFSSDLNETTSKVGVLFGDMSADMKKWAETANTSFGLSKRAALDGASDFAIFGKSAGLAGKDLTDFSKQNVKLASDMASFFNTSPEEAITAIGAVFRGESEPIRRYGVLLNEASLKDEALRQGLIRTNTDALTPQQRILAASALIMKQTGAAQGDFARTSDQLANSMRIAKAQLEDAAAALGTNLLPIVTKGIGVVNGLLNAFQQLSPEMQNVILAAGGIAAALGPVMSISGKLITAFVMLKGGAADAVGSIITLGKDARDVSTYLKDAGISARTLIDSLKYLRTSGAGLSLELGIIVAGLIAVAKYLGEVDAASKATNETLIEMSHSGDVFKQAAATTEIFANGQKRLKGALDGVNESLKTNAASYADYRAGVEGAAKAAGFQVDANGNLIQSFNGMAGAQQKVIQANYVLTDSEYAANKALHERGGLLDRGLKGLIDLANAINLYNEKQRAGVNTTDELYRSMNALNQGVRNQAAVYATLDDAMNPVLAKQRLLDASTKIVANDLEILKTGIAGAVKNEDQRYAESQESLQKRLKDTANELQKLEREQGAVDKSTTKNAMSAAELAKAQATLASTQARLAQETDPTKQNELAASIAVQQERIAGANQAVVTYIDNSQRISDLKGTYEEITKEIDKTKQAHEESTKRILYGYAEQAIAAYNAQHGIIGTTDKQAEALDKLAVKLGIKSQEDVDAYRAVLQATSDLAKDGNTEKFAYNSAAGFDKATKAAGGFVESIYPVTKAIDETALKALGLYDAASKKTDKPITVPIKTGAKKAEDEIGQFVDSPKVKKAKEPIKVDVKADTSNAVTGLQYLSSYGVNPLIAEYDALIQRASIFNTIVGQTPSIPGMPTTPTTPTKKPHPGVDTEFARGADFIVPAGYANDSFPMRVSSGEHVKVTPAGKGDSLDSFPMRALSNARLQAPTGTSGGGQVPAINITQNFSGAQSSPEQYKAIMYEVITNVFETAMRQ